MLLYGFDDCNEFERRRFWTSHSSLRDILGSYRTSPRQQSPHLSPRSCETLIHVVLERRRIFESDLRPSFQVRPSVPAEEVNPIVREVPPE